MSRRAPALPRSSPTWAGTRTRSTSTYMCTAAGCEAPELDRSCRDEDVEACRCDGGLLGRWAAGLELDHLNCVDDPGLGILHDILARSQPDVLHLGKKPARVIGAIE